LIVSKDERNQVHFQVERKDSISKISISCPSHPYDIRLGSSHEQQIDVESVDSESTLGLLMSLISHSSSFNVENEMMNNTIERIHKKIKWPTIHKRIRKRISYTHNESCLRMDITKTYQSDPRLSFEDDFMNNINSQSSSSSSSRHQPSQSQQSPPCTYEVEMEVRDPKVIENWLDTSSSSSGSGGVSRFVKYQTIIHSHMLSIIKRINPIQSISSLLDHSFNTLTVFSQFSSDL